MKNILYAIIIFLVPNVLFAQHSDWKTEQSNKPVKVEILSTYNTNEIKRKVVKGSLVAQSKSYYSNQGLLSKHKTIVGVEKNDSSITNYYYAIDKLIFTKQTHYTAKRPSGRKRYYLTVDWTPNGSPKTLLNSKYSKIGFIVPEASTSVFDTTSYLYQDYQIIESKISSRFRITTEKFEYNQLGLLAEKQWTEVTKKTNDSISSKTIYHYNAEQSKNWTSRTYEQNGVFYITEREFIYYQEEETKELNNTPKYSLFNIKTPDESIPDMIYKEYQHRDDYFKTYWNIMITISCLNEFKENYKYLAQDNIPIRTYKLLQKQEAYYAMSFYGDLVLAMSEKLIVSTENSENTILYWELLGSLIKNEGYVNINQPYYALFYAEHILDLSGQYRKKEQETHTLLKCNNDFFLNYSLTLYNSGREPESLKLLNAMSSKITIEKCNYEDDIMKLGEVAEQVGELEIANKAYTELKGYVETEYGKESELYKEVVINLISVKKKLVN